MNKNTCKKEELRFPLRWHSCLIVQSGFPTGQAEIEAVFLANKAVLCSLQSGKSSSKGSFISWRITADIHNKEQFEAICSSLQELQGVKILL